MNIEKRAHRIKKTISLDDFTKYMVIEGCQSISNSKQINDIFMT